MPPQLHLLIDGHRLSCPLDKPADLGRQETWAEPMLSPIETRDAWRIAVADHGQSQYSRHQLLIKPDGADAVVLVNRRDSNRIDLGATGALEPGEQTRLRLPAIVEAFGGELQLEAEDAWVTQTLMAPTPPPSGTASGLQFPQPLSLDKLHKLDEATGALFEEWLKSITDVAQRAAGAFDFGPRAVEEISELVHLDVAHLIKFDAAGGWQSVAKHCRAAGIDDDSNPSTQILQRVWREKRTFWQVPDARGGSLLAMEAVVAAPLLNTAGQVTGALYGDRRTAQQGDRRHIDRQPIGHLEALLVEALACTVSAGWSRIEQEKAAVEAQVRFEQFFTPELARQLAVNRDLLECRDTAVTLLLCDIRGFSRIAERLGAGRTVAWLGAVMGEMGDRVVEHGGALVDNVGDELLAMWGAPTEQPDQAERACRAALAMVHCLPQIDARWMDEIGAETRLGFGINSGVARVGNTGSRRKFRYGPLGPTVNVASRVQGATKYLKTDILLTATCRAQLAGNLPLRRVGRVRVVNIDEPVELFELQTTADPRERQLAAAYEQALAAFEAGQLHEAVECLSSVLREFRQDGPTLLLLSRAVSALADQQTAFDPVFDLPGK